MVDLTDEQRARLNKEIYEFLLLQKGPEFARAAHAFFVACPDDCFDKGLEVEIERYTARPILVNKWLAMERIQEKFLEAQTKSIQDKKKKKKFKSFKSKLPIFRSTSKVDTEEETYSLEKDTEKEPDEFVYHGNEGHDEIPKEILVGEEEEEEEERYADETRMLRQQLDDIGCDLGEPQDDWATPPLELTKAWNEAAEEEFRKSNPEPSLGFLCW